MYNLDLVALMAGGRFQDTANLFVDRMEAFAKVKTELTSASVRSSADRVATSTPHHGKADLAAPMPVLKKAKHHRSAPAGQSLGTGRRVRRIRLPPLEVFQREYMETATPVILTGVSATWYYRTYSYVSDGQSYLALKV